jgi:hypothetical protein
MTNDKEFNRSLRGLSKGSRVESCNSYIETACDRVRLPSERDPSCTNSIVARCIRVLERSKVDERAGRSKEQQQKRLKRT